MRINGGVRPAPLLSAGVTNRHGIAGESACLAASAKEWKTGFMIAQTTERIDTPRRAISPKAIVAAVAIIVAGVAATILAVVFGGGTTVSPYEAELSPLVVRHNAVVRQWNNFLIEYNGISLADPRAFDARAVDGLALVERLASESQGVILAWDKVVAPPEMDAAHRFARDAMRLTQDGFIELGTYFSNIVTHGIAFDDELRAGTSRLEAASVLWSQARAAAEPAN